MLWQNLRMKKSFFITFLSIFFSLSILSDEYIYLGCGESAETTVKDLLNNKTLKPLSKREKERMKRFFDYEINKTYRREKVIAGVTKMPTGITSSLWDDRKDIRFHTFKISKQIDTEGRVAICKSTEGEDLTLFSPVRICDKYKKTTEDYIKVENFRERPVITKINRETLLFSVNGDPWNSFLSKEFQCHILSDKNELETLHKNYINYIAPLQDEWDVNVTNFLKQQRELEERNKI